MGKTQMRDAFEAHFALNSRQMMKRHDGSYFYADIQGKWEGYQAGLASAAQPAEPIPFLNELLRLVLANGEWSPQTATRLRDAIKATAGNSLYAAPAPSAPSDLMKSELAERVQRESQVGNFGDSGDEQLHRRLQSLPLPKY
jgi:hypothetical protein